MEKKLKRQRFINIVLVIALIVGFVQFKDFKTETENRFNNLSHQYNNLNSTISSIYNNVDEKLEQQASLITFFDFQYGELDSENLKVPVSVKIIPKTATASTKLTLDFGSRTVDMKKGENMEYTADFKSDLFLGESDETVKLIISEGNTTKSEELDWYISSLHNHFLPNLHGLLEKPHAHEHLYEAKALAEGFPPRLRLRFYFCIKDFSNQTDNSS